MGYNRLHALRQSDFGAAVWFKPSKLGGFAKVTHRSSIQNRIAVQANGELVEAAYWGGSDEWIMPGSSMRCGVGNHRWRDTDRRAIEIGTSLYFLITVNEGQQGPPQCVGLGRICERHDPAGRFFTADAMVHLTLSDWHIAETLPGRIIDLRFGSQGRTWEGHFDALDSSESDEAKKFDGLPFWLCLYFPVGAQVKGERYPAVGDAFTIFADDVEIGTGHIVERTGRAERRVCYPTGWLVGAGLERNSRLSD